MHSSDPNIDLEIGKNSGTFSISEIRGLLRPGVGGGEVSLEVKTRGLGGD